jgi:Uma2 family endonuclease
MSDFKHPAPIPVDDYLAGELISEVKHEYLGGEVHAMAGASNRHNKVAGNAYLALGVALRGKPCRPFNSDTKVRIHYFNHTRFYYPDAMVVCDENLDEDQWQDRPVVIVEVLSESTRRTDLAEKRDAYLTIPSLRVLIFAEPDRPALIVHRRATDGGFVREDYTGLDAVVSLPEIDSVLPLAEVYEAVEF